MKIFLIGVGSFIGGAGRYLLSLFLQQRLVSNFPIGTLTVNILGCFFIGVIFGISEKGNMSDEWRLFLATGILGGFTTFSAFSYESVNLIRSNELFYALLYIGASLLFGILATFIGVWLCKFF